MKKEKSPGLDGLPSEFYQCFRRNRLFFLQSS